VHAEAKFGMNPCTETGELSLHVLHFLAWCEAVEVSEKDVLYKIEAIKS